MDQLYPGTKGSDRGGWMRLIGEGRVAKMEDGIASAQLE